MEWKAKVIGKGKRSNTKQRTELEEYVDEEQRKLGFDGGRNWLDGEWWRSGGRGLAKLGSGNGGGVKIKVGKSCAWRSEARSASAGTTVKVTKNVGNLNPKIWHISE
ncbi:hypothetical protein HPP92_026007 [Vanilla planifolia]|uniref:Uncharacterized protein n=1 Tax=Vanilla planifolia TaxID=51239 RepID=A0A835PIK9_VANPL|nr:hypothetical protein HPP92_026007 [Vanilla planifolia]